MINDPYQIAWFLFRMSASISEIYQWLLGFDNILLVFYCIIYYIYLLLLLH